MGNMNPSIVMATILMILHSSMAILKQLPPPNDPTLVCDGKGFRVIPITLQDTTGCYTFQTPGFGAEGFPSASEDVMDKVHFCNYVFVFGSQVSGTVTIKKEGFRFENNGPNSCYDALAVAPVDDQAQVGQDPEDKDSTSNVVAYCGTLNEDKILPFNTNVLSIDAGADDSLKSPGADILICFD